MELIENANLFFWNYFSETMYIVPLKRVTEKKRQLEDGARYAIEVLRNCSLEGLGTEILVAAGIPQEADKCNCYLD